MSNEQIPVVSIGTIIGGTTADAECWKQATHDVRTRLVANRDSRGDEVSASELKVNFEVHIGVTCGGRSSRAFARDTFENAIIGSKSRSGFPKSARRAR